jgi:hypothetical protein
MLACGGGSETKQPDGVTIEVASNAPTPQPQELNGSSQPQTVIVSGPSQTLSANSPAPVATPGGKPATPPSSFNAAPLPATSLTNGRITMDGTSAPASGRWIDVDVTRHRVRLMNGTEVTRTIEPVAVGVQVDTGVYESTQTGTFRVHNKIGGLQYDAPYKTYISDWVGFDAPRANGFHSLLKDAQGNVADPSTGRISNGCIRVGDSAAVFAYAEIGMIVYVHH